MDKEDRVYLLKCGPHHKIGFSNNVQARIKQLQTGNAHKIILVAYCNGDKNLEHQLHRQYSSKRVSGEWFALSPFDIKIIIDLMILQHRGTKINPPKVSKNNRSCGIFSSLFSFKFDTKVEKITVIDIMSILISSTKPVLSSNKKKLISLWYIFRLRPIKFSSTPVDALKQAILSVINLKRNCTVTRNELKLSIDIIGGTYKNSDKKEALKRNFKQYYVSQHIVIGTKNNVEDIKFYLCYLGLPVTGSKSKMLLRLEYFCRQHK